eukprot:m.18736 g.18736  ORF g.18736 m.18736 type:complete len:532 (-) comp5004_c1_seq1:342-1937(-)
MSNQARPRRRTVDLTGKLSQVATNKTQFVDEESSIGLNKNEGGPKQARPSFFEEHKSLFKVPVSTDASRPVVFAPLLSDSKSKIIEENDDDVQRHEKLVTSSLTPVSTKPIVQPIPTQTRSAQHIGRKQTARKKQYIGVGDEEEDYSDDEEDDEMKGEYLQTDFEDQLPTQQSERKNSYFDVKILPSALVAQPTSKQERIGLRKKSKMLMELMDKHGDPTEKMKTLDAFDITPLHRACRQGDTLAVGYILEVMPKYNSSRANNGATPSHDAAATGHIKCLQLMLAKEPSVARLTLKKNQLGLIHLASMFGQVGVVKFLIEGKYAVANECAANGSTPLHYAAMGGHLECVQFIASTLNSEDINATNDDNATALHRACVGNHAACVRELIKHGSDPNIISMGVDCVQLAVRRGHSEIVLLLLDEFPHLILRCTIDGASLWHFACAAGHPSLLKDLLEYAERNAIDTTDVWTDTLGNTPVHDAAANGTLDCLNVLLDREFPVGVKNFVGKTPAALAREHNHTECAILLTLRSVT